MLGALLTSSYKNKEESKKGKDGKKEKVMQKVMMTPFRGAVAAVVIFFVPPRFGYRVSSPFVPLCSCFSLAALVT